VKTSAQLSTAVDPVLATVTAAVKPLFQSLVEYVTRQPFAGVGGWLLALVLGRGLAL
jgi:hypothetical protein